jgi:peptide/nickel transport system substrate-binding protein
VNRKVFDTTCLRVTSTFRVVGLISLVVFITSCMPSAPTTPSNNPASQSSGERVLTASLETEPSFIAGMAPVPGLGATDFWQRTFNAFLELNDGDGQARPYLAEALPVLNTESWEVFPDGTMETRYRLKPNLVWHDGTPLTANDFVFSFENATPRVGFRTGVVPYNQMERVIASDDRSLQIRWKSLYPDAGVLLGSGSRMGLVPFPRHLLESTFAGADPATVQGSNYWGREFVGAGPFKLDRWEPGSFLEAVAFDQHVLGRPRIDRIRFLFLEDPNTAFANMLAESTHVALNSMGFDHFIQLKRQWAQARKGVTGLSTSSLTAAQFQFRPEYAEPRVVLDVRVRRALAHAVDRQTLSDTIWAGELLVQDSIFDPTTPYYPTIERAVMKYPYDLAATERLMNEAGIRKGPDGVYTGPDGPLSFTLQAPSDRQELPILAGNWRTAGFNVQEQGLAGTDARDSQVRSTFKSMSINTSGAPEIQQIALYRASLVTSAENRWRGENRGGWANLEFDRLADAYFVTLDPEQRIQQRAQMAKVLTEDLPALTLTPNANTFAYLNSVKNVGKTMFGTTGRITWNIHEWELQ